MPYIMLICAEEADPEFWGVNRWAECQPASMSMSAGRSATQLALSSICPRTNTLADC